MSVRLSLANVIAGLDSSRLSASSGTATGYDLADLVAGDIARSWASNNSATTHTIDVRTPVGAKVRFAAIFDLRALGGVASITSVEVLTSATWPISSPSAWGLMDVSSRGDGCDYASTPIAVSGLRFRITLSLSAKISAGLLWAGDWTDLPSYFASRADSPSFATIRNESEAGSVFAHELADYRERFALDFPPIVRDDMEEFRAAWLAARGDARPIVILPDSDFRNRAYHGRCTAEFQATNTHPGIWSGLSISFEESGRGLGGG